MQRTMLRVVSTCLMTGVVWAATPGGGLGVFLLQTE